jgi:hypothetical protein
MLVYNPLATARIEHVRLPVSAAAAGAAAAAAEASNWPADANSEIPSQSAAAAAGLGVAAEAGGELDTATDAAGIRRVHRRVHEETTVHEQTVTSGHAGIHAEVHGVRYAHSASPRAAAPGLGLRVIDAATGAPVPSTLLPAAEPRAPLAGRAGGLQLVFSVSVPPLSISTFFIEAHRSSEVATKGEGEGDSEERKRRGGGEARRGGGGGGGGAEGGDGGDEAPEGLAEVAAVSEGVGGSVLEIESPPPPTSSTPHDGRQPVVTLVVDTSTGALTLRASTGTATAATDWPGSAEVASTGQSDASAAAAGTAAPDFTVNARVSLAWCDPASCYTLNP